MVTYGEVVRAFDHAQLAALSAYARLRQALSDLANEAPEGYGLGPFLAAVRDMAATAPFGDTCERCDKACTCPPETPFPDPCGAFRFWWPHAVEREGGWITGT